MERATGQRLHGRHRRVGDRRGHGGDGAAHQHSPPVTRDRRSLRAGDRERDRAGDRVPRLRPARAPDVSGPSPLRDPRLAGVHDHRALLDLRGVRDGARAGLLLRGLPPHPGCDRVTRRILVVGLRATGEAVVGHFARAGDRVTVVEEDPGQPSYAARVAAVGALGAELVERPAPEAWEVLVASSDLVVPSPGVRPGHPVYVAALAQGVPVRSDVDVAVELASVPVVAVTGTNGKTTVTTLVTDMLRASGVRAVSAGNIGVAALGVLDVPMDVLVVEVSSFQLHATTSTFRPRVAVLLNIADDHLDWHGSFAAYAEAKAQVFAHQSADDVLVSNV
ncbi:MAG: hypothetical protein FJW88_14640, partial [Actinobacteria bacterium]|nr:hypothetical protein [Actinomycetota bacterium]